MRLARRSMPASPPPPPSDPTRPDHHEPDAPRPPAEPAARRRVATARLAAVLRFLAAGLVALAVALPVVGTIAARRHTLVVQIVEPYDADTAGVAALTDGALGRPIGPPLRIVSFRRRGILPGEPRDRAGHLVWSLDGGRPLQRATWDGLLLIATFFVAGVAVAAALLARGMRRLDDVLSAEDRLAADLAEAVASSLPAARAATADPPPPRAPAPPSGLTPSA